MISLNTDVLKWKGIHIIVLFILTSANIAHLPHISAINLIYILQTHYTGEVPDFTLDMKTLMKTTSILN